MANFDLTENPFAVLGVSPRAKRLEIENAFEDEVIEHPEQEARLLKLKQALLSPPPRLIAELTWLADVAPSKARKLLALVETSELEKLIKEIPGLPPLSAANLSADAAFRLREVRFLDHLLKAHDDISPETVTAWMQSVRATSGFPAVQPAQVADAIKVLRKEHALAAMGAIGAHDEPSSILTDLMGTFDSHHSQLLIELMQAFDSWSAPRLSSIASDIDRLVPDVLAAKRGSIEELGAALEAWDRLSQPAQIFAQASGLDEVRSLKVYRNVRGVCITLANDQGRYDDAQTLAVLMKDLFRELPTAERELDNDLSILTDLSDEAAAEKLVEPLKQALSEARVRSDAFRRDLKHAGFRAATGFPDIDQMYSALSAACADLRSSRQPDLPLILVRNLALDLHNEMGDPAASLSLLQGAITIAAPQDPGLEARISNDLRVLRLNLGHARLANAIQANHYSNALEILGQMLPDAEEERVQLLDVQARLEQKRTGRWLKIGGWGIAAVVALIFIISENAGSSSPSYSPTYDPTTYVDSPASTGNQYDSTLPIPSTDAALPPPSIPDASPDYEAIPTSSDQPPIGTNLVLPMNQLKYCTFEELRLQALERLVTGESPGSVIDRFNGRIDDYNSRCGSFQYRVGDLEIAKASAQSASARLNSEADRVLESWADE